MAAAGQAGNGAEKVLVCHGTASAVHPYSLISVDIDALPAHLDSGHGCQNAPDFLRPAGYATCEDAVAGRGGQQ